MSIGGACARLIKGEEGLSLTAYRDTAGVWTIGWGTTQYPDGRPVRQGDWCTEQDAESYFIHDLAPTALAVSQLTPMALTQGQRDALVSFAYNNGVQAYRTSHLRVLVMLDPNDPAIRDEFMRWHFDHPIRGGPAKAELGLWIRRHREADHYFGVYTPCPPMPRTP